MYKLILILFFFLPSLLMAHSEGHSQGLGSFILDEVDTLMDVGSSNRVGTLSSGWSGAGGDGKRQIADNIWYLGEKPVHYCLKVSDDYPFAKDQVSQLVDGAFKKWKTFFQHYGLDKQRVNQNLEFPSGANLNASLDFREVSCEDLKNHIGEELVFLFGLENKVIKEIKEFHFGHALGTAVRDGYNHQTYRNRGMVSIANFSNKLRKVEHLVLHEVGHVMGMHHDSVFVMDTDVAEKLEKDLIPGNWLGHIESPWWVFKLRDGQNLVLTRRRPKNKSQVGFRCRFGYSPNGMIPNVIRKQYGFEERGCHQVQLFVQQFYGNRKFNVQIQVKDLNNNTMTLYGSLQSSAVRALNNKSPGVFTMIKNSKFPNNGLKWRRIAFGEDILQFPARGVLQSDKGKRIAARLSQEGKGLVLELLVGKSRRWWIIQ